AGAGVDGLRRHCRELTYPMRPAKFGGAPIPQHENSSMKRVNWCAPGLLVCAILSGCGESQGNVTGTVTMDGQPVSSGSITFVKAEGGQIREGAVIKDGGFQAKLPPGKYKIELSGQKVVGKRTQKGFDGKDEVIEVT